MRLRLTRKVANDLQFILAHEVTVPKAIRAAQKKYGSPLSQERIDSLTETMTTLWQRLEDQLAK